MELRRALETRRMTRDFLDSPLEPTLLNDLVGLAARSPSAGKTQGWSLLVLQHDAKEKFWDLSLPIDKRDGFAWPGLLRAPVIALSFANPDAYVERYAEPDKQHTGLGAGVEKWPTPYWTVDASMATMALLLAAHDAGLGALFFAVFNDPRRIRDEFGVPENLELIGAVALGHPNSGSRSRPGVSAKRARSSTDEIIHRNRW
jgi:nitroreductase